MKVGKGSTYGCCHLDVPPRKRTGGWEQEDFSKSQIQNEKQGSLAKGIALIENNFHVAKHCVISKVCVQSRGLGILICETCSCSTSDLGCVFM